VYQTVAHSGSSSSRGSEILFIHANWKDASDVPVKLLREAGTPVCAIVDIDVLNSEATFKTLISALSHLGDSDLPMSLKDVAGLVEGTTQADLLDKLTQAVHTWLETNHNDLRGARRALVRIAKSASKWDAVKKQGLDFFKGPDRLSVEALLAACKARGLFIVPKGELEGWMRLGLTKGKTWNRAALEKLHMNGCPPELRSFVDEVVDSLDSQRP
jgi:hypothetical protein